MMIESNYEFLVRVNGNSLREYNVNGKTTLGVKPGDKFSLWFRNGTPYMREVSFAIDGKCPASGKKASSDPKNNGKFVVRPYSSMELSAWVESDTEGAAFVFTDVASSVVANTPDGNMSYKGVLSVAVFKDLVERPEVKYSAPTWPSKPMSPSWSGNYRYGSMANEAERGHRGMMAGMASLGSLEADTRCINSTGLENAIFSNCVADYIPSGSPPPVEDVAVGAGETIKQHITYTSGLAQPTLDRILVMRYVPLAQLEPTAKPSPTGFEDYDNKFADLKGVPRVLSNQAVVCS